MTLTAGEKAALLALKLATHSADGWLRWASPDAVSAQVRGLTGSTPWDDDLAEALRGLSGEGLVDMDRGTEAEGEPWWYRITAAGRQLP